MNGNTIYHVHLNVAINGQLDFFFGSIAAIFDHLGPNHVGITKQSLYDFKILPGNPYRNKCCTITKGAILRKKGNRKKPN